MIDDITQFLLTITPLQLILFTFLITYIENLFPPSPSDVTLIFCGTLIPLGVIDFLPLLIAATLGSVSGFITMYGIGWKIGEKIYHWKFFRFLSPNAIEGVEKWFQKYGYGLIIANRFLSGTRAVISFFAGMSKLRFDLTLLLSAISSLLWNAILLYLGYVFGANWEKIAFFLEMYGKTVTGIAAVIILILVLRWLYFNKREQKNAP